MSKPNPKSEIPNPQSDKPLPYMPEDLDRLMLAHAKGKLPDAIEVGRLFATLGEFIAAVENLGAVNAGLRSQASLLHGLMMKLGRVEITNAELSKIPKGFYIRFLQSPNGEGITVIPMTRSEAGIETEITVSKIILPGG